MLDPDTHGHNMFTEGRPRHKKKLSLIVSLREEEMKDESSVEWLQIEQDGPPVDLMQEGIKDEDDQEDKIEENEKILSNC